MLKSLPSNDGAYISFRNESLKVVDIIWHDFDGNMVKYGTLFPNGTQDINTFSKHPWQSFDHSTGNELLLNGRPVYFAESVREIHQRLRFVRVPVRSVNCGRIPVVVTSPFGTLLELCKQFILRNIDTSDDIEVLEIPEMLKSQLRQMINKKKAYHDRLHERQL